MCSIVQVTPQILVLLMFNHPCNLYFVSVLLIHRKCRCDHHKFMRASQVSRKCRRDRQSLMRTHLDASHVQVWPSWGHARAS